MFLVQGTSFMNYFMNYNFPEAFEIFWARPKNANHKKSIVGIK